MRSRFAAPFQGEPCSEWPNEFKYGHRGEYDRADRRAKLRETFITGILYNRFVEHIRDLRIQKLAVPGFVVRLITPIVLRDVMARATVARKP